MKSATAISYELDDISTTAKELTEQIRDKLAFRKNTVAILHGQPDMEIGELSSAISHDLGCRVIGGTTAAGAVLTNDGYHELAVILHVLTDDESLFAAAISDSMETDPQKTLKATYEKAYQDLKGQDPSAEPRLIICVASIVASYSSDDIISELSRASYGLPIFGYNAGDDFEFCKQQVFLDGAAGGDRLAILLIAGDIKPIFQVESLAGKQTLEKRLVTRASGNIIYEIDGKPAYDYIKDFPFIDDETKALFNYQFFVEMKNASGTGGSSGSGNNSGDSSEGDGDGDGDGDCGCGCTYGYDCADEVPVSRALNTYNKETGEVTCFANVPQGSQIGLRYCDGNDVANTTEMGLRELTAKMEPSAGDYEYSTLLIATCSLRNMFLADLKETEGNLVKDLIPPSLTVSGLYAFGEIAPTSSQFGKAVNRFHNATFTVCAF